MAARGATALSAQANLVGLVEEGEVMRLQPIVAKDDVRVAVHVELYKVRRLVEAAQHQPGLDSSAGRAERAVSTTGGRGAGAPAGSRELGRQGPVDKAVQRPRVEQTLDPPPAGWRSEPAIHPGQVGARVRAGSGGQRGRRATGAGGGPARRREWARVRARRSLLPRTRRRQQGGGCAGQRRGGRGRALERMGGAVGGEGGETGGRGVSVLGAGARPGGGRGGVCV